MFLRKLVFLAVIIVSMMSGLHTAKNNHYQSKAWSNWVELSSYTAQFLDYRNIPPDRITGKAFAFVGWTRNDFDMINTWQYLDSERFSTEKFSHVMNYLQVMDASNNKPLMHREWYRRLQGNLRYLGGSLNAYFSNNKRNLSSLKLAGSLVWCLLIAILFTARSHSKNWIYLTALAVTGVAAVFYLVVILNRFPLRIMLILGSTWLWCVIMLKALKFNSPENEKVITPKYVTRLFVPATVIILLAAGYYDLSGLRKAIHSRIAERTVLEAEFDNWNKNLPEEAVVYNIGARLRSESLSPLSDLHLTRILKRFIGTGSKNQSPLQKAKLNNLGFTGSNFYKNLMNRKHVYIVNPRGWGTGHSDFKILKRYYSEVHKVKLSFKEEPNLSRLSSMSFKPLINETPQNTLLNP